MYKSCRTTSSVVQLNRDTLSSPISLLFFSIVTLNLSFNYAKFLLVSGAPVLNNIEDNGLQELPNLLNYYASLSFDSGSVKTESRYINTAPTQGILTKAQFKTLNQESELPSLKTTDHENSLNKILTGPIARSVGRSKRHQEINPECEFTVSRRPMIYGLRCDTCSVAENGGIIIKASEQVKMLLIGRNLYSNLSVALTPSEGVAHDDCTHTDRIKTLRIFNLTSNVAETMIELSYSNSQVPFYFCLREAADGADWFHQGSEPWLTIFVHQDFLPLYMKLITIAFLLGLSGLFSGLNLGLMSLDKNELQVIMKCGSDSERRYARVIEPVRKRGNYLLCSILFSNTLVNSTISVFLEDLSDGLIAIMTSTILIVLFGEILPQAFCSRHGLAVGARTVYLTNFCMYITFPLSYPVSRCLDWALGEEIGHAYDRERLMEFIRITKDVNNLETDEVNIISGALKIKHIHIKEIMTRIEDVFMISETSVLDFDTIQAIVTKGYSRIPVHAADDEKNIVAVLFAKDLALVDPDDNTPVQTMITFYNHQRMFVEEDDTLDIALNEFKTGKSHMAIVQRLVNDGDKDPYYENTGIVTLEDVIEEIMQMEINDETDIWTDNRRKRRIKNAQIRKDFSHFTNLGTGDSSFNIVTPQLCLAAYQYLATTVEPFSPNHLSDSVLRRLMSQKIFYKVKPDDDESLRNLYTAGTPADYFIMILEGRVHVVCGQEGLAFDGGPFMSFGRAALTVTNKEDVANQTSPGKESNAKTLSRRESIVKGVSVFSTKKITDIVDNTALATGLTENTEPNTNSFVPDYTVYVIATTAYLKVTHNDYLAAIKATHVERAPAPENDVETESIFIKAPNPNTE